MAIGHWRDTYRPARLGPFDGRIVFVLLPAAFHVAIWTLLISVTTVALLWYFEQYRRLTIGSAWRWLRSSLLTFLTGPTRPARLLAKTRHAVDFSRRPQ